MFRERIGYGKRVKNSVFGFIFGMILCFGAVVLMAWNERDAVRQTGAITEIDKVALANVPSASVDGVHDGKLVHMNGTATTDEVLENSEFGIRENAIRLRWDSAIYQWKEKKEKSDNEVRYSYSEAWVDKPIDSDGFRYPNGHSNENSAQHFHDGEAQAEDVRFGAFQLSRPLIRQINVEEPLQLDTAVLEQAGGPQGTFREGVFYTGNPSSPRIGDERVEMFIVGPTHDVTVMARQTGTTFASYETKVGVDKEILYVGNLTKDEVIGRQRTEAAFKRWLLRGAGFLCVWIGSTLLLKPIRALLSFVPFLGRILDGAIGVVGFLIAAMVSTVVIGLAWLAVRPVLSIILLLAAAVSAVLLYRQKTPDQAPSPAVPPPLPPNLNA